MMASYQSLQQTIEDIEIAKYTEELEKGLCVKDAKMEAKRRTKALMNLIDTLDEDALKALISFIKSFTTPKNPPETSKPNEADKNSEKIEKQETKDKPKTAGKTQVDDKKKSPGPQKSTDAKSSS